MKPNLVIIGFEKEFNKKLCIYLADKLDMFFVDVKELIEYDLVNSKEALLRCGKEYIEKEERKTVRNVSEYENSVVNIPYDIFITNRDFFKAGNINIFIKPFKADDIDDIVMQDRIALLKNDCHIFIENSENNIEKCYNLIMSKLKGDNRWKLIKSA